MTWQQASPKVKENIVSQTHTNTHTHVRFTPQRKLCRNDNGPAKITRWFLSAVSFWALRNFLSFLSTFSPQMSMWKYVKSEGVTLRRNSLWAATAHIFRRITLLTCHWPLQKQTKKNPNQNKTNKQREREREIEHFTFSHFRAKVITKKVSCFKITVYKIVTSQWKIKSHPPIFKECSFMLYYPN